MLVLCMCRRERRRDGPHVLDRFADHALADRQTDLPERLPREADVAAHDEHALGLLLDIDRGVCRECKLLPATEVQDAPFVIVADHARWKMVIKKELDPIKGMMQNKLKLTKGHMPTIVKYVNSSRELVETTSLVATKFRDEV